MDQPSSQWRQMFDRGRRAGASEDGVGPRAPAPQAARSSVYDDGYDPARRGAAALPPETISEEAALALVSDTSDYRPWVLQRGRSHPPIMLHLRRFEPRSGFWVGWQLSYPHLAAVEYCGDKMLSLDFGARQFVVTGEGLGELVAHLQTGSVLSITEYSGQVWPNAPSGGGRITSIKCLGQGAAP